MEIIVRAQWGARPPKRLISQTHKNVQGWIVHHTATPGDGDIARRIRGMQNYHMDDKKWTDLAYNYLIDQTGQIWEGRGFASRSGANDAATNRKYWSAAFIGNFETDVPSGAAIEAFQWLRCQQVLQYNPGATKVAVHSDVKNTACPGRNLTALRAELTLTCPIEEPPPPIPPTAAQVADPAKCIPPEAVAWLREILTSP